MKIFAYLHALLVCLVTATILRAAEFTYTLPRAGNTSLAIYDSQGRQVRTILAGDPLTAGVHTASWDGLDRLGNPQPPGTYTWKVLLNDGLESDFLASLGQNPIDPSKPWEWTVGSHQGPCSIALGADGSLFHGSRNSEGPPVIQKLASPDGPILWSLDWQTDGPPLDMVELGEHLIRIGRDARLYRNVAATGSSSGSPVDLLWPGDARGGSDDPVNSYGLKLAAASPYIVVAYRNHDTLRWLDPTTGAIARSLALPQPHDVASGPDGILYAISGTSLVTIGPDNARTTLLSVGTLDSPKAIAYDATNQQLLIATGGTDQRILRFALDGTPIASYGRLGGRLDGAYVSSDFRDVTDLACDNAGGFYAVESDHLRRIVHVSSAGLILKNGSAAPPSSQ